MIKKIIVIVTLSLILFQGSAFAFEANGEILFRDALYGAAIGGLLGTAMYVADTDSLGSKVGGGVLLGTIVGLAYGFAETNSFVELKDNKIKMAIPTPVIVPKNNDIQYSASLFKARF